MTSGREAQAVETQRGAGQLLYLYGVVAPDSDAAALLQMGRMSGIEPDQPLFAIGAAGLVAVVSLVPADVFDEEPLNALVSDLERLTPYAVRHEEAVRALLDSAVIPMTFGAVYRTPERVAALLAEQAPYFRGLLSRFQGRREWGVKVFADHARLLQIAEQESDALRGLAEEAATARPGRAYLIARKRDQQLAAEASQLAADPIAQILGRLGDLSGDVVQDDPGPVQPGDEQLALKAAFLVDDRRHDTFRDAVAELADACAPRGLRLELSGPWAPYSFVRSRGATDG